MGLLWPNGCDMGEEVRHCLEVRSPYGQVGVSTVGCRHEEAHLFGRAR